MKNIFKDIRVSIYVKISWLLMLKFLRFNHVKTIDLYISKL